MGNLRPASLLVLGVGVAGFVALLLAASSDLKLGAIAVGGFAGAVLVFAGLGWVAVKLLRRVVNEATAPRWLVLATRQISARPAYTVVQTSAAPARPPSNAFEPDAPPATRRRRVVRGVPLWGTAVAMAATTALGAWWASTWDDAPAEKAEPVVASHAAPLLK